MPYDSGVAFVRDAEAFRRALAVTAEYLPTETPHLKPSDFTPELSRRARGAAARIAFANRNDPAALR